MGAVKVSGFGFVKAVVWLGLAAIVTVAAFVIRAKFAGETPSHNPVHRNSVTPSATVAKISDYTAVENNKKLNQRIQLSENDRNSREHIKAVSDIKTANPAEAVPALKLVLESPGESASAKTLALSKLIELNTEDSMAEVISYVCAKDSSMPWVRNTAVALLVKTNTPLSKAALDMIKTSGDAEVVDFLNKLQR